MVRALCLFGMTGGFLVISPKLRDSVLETFSQAATGMAEHSPYSYVALGVVVLLILMFVISRGSAVR
ncbi:MAG TPA: hypothetical protein VGH38_34900 [Bryobacteraceae bacterium]|jgi:hypothetical protein